MVGISRSEILILASFHLKTAFSCIFHSWPSDWLWPIAVLLCQTLSFKKVYDGTCLLCLYLLQNVYGMWLILAFPYYSNISSLS